MAYSAFAVRDPRVTEQENSDFLDTLEDYFGQPDEIKIKDVRPDLHYQVGATPANVELPRCARDDSCLGLVDALADEDKPLDFTGKDPKWRFFWRIGQIPKSTNYPQLNADPVIPASIPDWAAKMNHWGECMHTAIKNVCQVSALGLGLPRDTFVNIARDGPHLLAPTGSDLSKYGQVGTVLAGFHTDLNLITIHGKSRFAGLKVWTPAGKKLLVKIPDGCLLVQAGKQMEFLTGGQVKAGFHEVSVVEETLEAIQRQKDAGRPLWRISSTLFFHTASDNYLEPLEHFRNETSIKAYPKQTAGAQVRKELEFISLASE
jgi:isopenicillin N synthase-like dioxygenase